MWAWTFLHTSWTLLKKSCFPDCWKVSLVVPVFKNVGGRSRAKNYCPISVFSVVREVFEKLVNNKIVDHLKKCALFSNFQYGFRSTWATADLLTVVSDRTARAFDYDIAFICDIAIHAGDITLYSKCDETSDLWQQPEWFLSLNLIYEALWTGVRSGLLISMLGKISWFRLTILITLVLLMWKSMGLFLRKNHLLRCWGWPSFLNWIGVRTLSLLLKLPPRKFEP